LPEIKVYLTAAGLPTDGDGKALRARLKEHLSGTDASSLPPMGHSRDELWAAACGKTLSQGGMNLPDVKGVLRDAGLSTDGDSKSLRVRLKEHLQGTSKHRYALTLSCAWFA
jgi:hypothetical protein